MYRDRRRERVLWAIGSATLFLLAFASVAWSECSMTYPQVTVLEIQTCERIIPERVPRIVEYAAEYEKRISSPNRAKAETQQLVDSYRGAWLGGRRVSAGKNCDPDPQKPSDCTRAAKAGVVEAATMKEHYFVASSDPAVCDRYKPGSKAKLIARPPCCDGGGWSPCLFKGLK